jgi:hypothetical protein
MTIDTMTTTELLGAARAMLLRKQRRPSAPSAAWRPRQSVYAAGGIEHKEGHFRRHYTEVETHIPNSSWRRVGDDAWVRVD